MIFENDEKKSQSYRNIDRCSFNTQKNRHDKCNEKRNFSNLRIQISFTRIIFSFRVIDSIIEINFVDFNNFEMINFMFKPRDINNIKTQLRRESFGPLTSMQTLIKEFDENDWFYEMQKNNLNQITHLFFVKGTQQIFLKVNHEILIMNCTYKIN